MPYLSNSPQDVTVFEAEARKSFAIGVWLKDSNKNPVDLTDTSTTFTLGTVDAYGIATALVSVTAIIVAPGLGYMTFNLQADDLDLKPGTYYFTTTLRIQGYSVVLMKGDFKVLQNMEFASVGGTYVGSNPAQNLEVVLRDQSNVHVTLSAALPPNLVIPTDASDQAVAGYIVNTSSLTRAALDGIYATDVELVPIKNDIDTLEGIVQVHDDWLNCLDSIVSTISSWYMDSRMINAKGDLIVGRADNNPQVLSVGTNGTFLTADSTQLNGVKWYSPPYLRGGMLAEANNTFRWVRVAILDGLGVNNGAAIQLEYGAGGNYGTFGMVTGRINFQQRGTDGVLCEVYNDAAANGGGEFPVFYTRRISSFVFELWAALSSFANPFTVRELNAFPQDDARAKITMDNVVTAAPSSLVRVVPIVLNNRGTTAQRDASYGVPANAAEQAALANASPVWWNTSKGWLEGYYAPVGTAGLTAQPLLSGRPAGWYPIAGKLPHVSIRIPSIGGIGPNQYRFRTGYWNNPPADQISDITVDNTNGVLTLPVIGTYVPSWSITQGTVSGASLVITAALNSSTPTSAPAGTVFGVNGVFGGVEIPSSASNYTFNLSPPHLKFSTSAATDNLTFWFCGGTGTSNVIGWSASYPGMVIGQSLRLDYVSPPFISW